MSVRVLSVALPLPFQAPFSYRVPEGTAFPDPGCRVLVPFGKELTVTIE